jgi:hypothetical protein
VILLDLLEDTTMRRYTIGLLVTLALGLLLAPLATEAQEAGKVARIGWLFPFPRPPQSLSLPFFRQVMAELGWMEGQNMRIRVYCRPAFRPAKTVQPLVRGTAR